MTTLATERLRLRPWRETDKAPFAALNNDRRVYATLAGPMARGDSDALADRIIAHISEHGWGSRKMHATTSITRCWRRSIRCGGMCCIASGAARLR